MRGDEELLTRLLENLIANAVRATARGGQVEISGWRASPGLIRLGVKDNGEGIPAVELPKLVAGLRPGRGLPIARDIAQRHRRDPLAENRAGHRAPLLLQVPPPPP